MAKVIRCTFDGARGKVSGEIIISLNRLDKLIDKLMSVEEFAYDTEFTDLQVQYKGKSILVGVSFCFGEKENYYIPLGHKDWSLLTEERKGYESQQLNVLVVMKKLKPVFERKVLVIGHNLKIDMHPLANYGIVFNKCDIFDTMEGTFIIDENVPKGLKAITQMMYNVPQVEYSAVVGTVSTEEKKLVGLKGNNKATIDLVRISNAGAYAMADSYWTWRHYVDWIMDGIESEGMEAIYYKVRMPFLRSLYLMERRGLRIDVPKLQDMQKRAEKDLESTIYEIYEETGVEFNVGSSQQVSELLFGYAKINKKGEFSGNKELIDASYNFPVQGSTKGGAPSTGESELLAILKNTYRDSRKIEGQRAIKLILKYKKLAKLKNAFMDGLLELMFEDGKVHPSINSCGAESGRLSCSSPNLQQLPRPVEVPEPPNLEDFENRPEWTRAVNEYKKVNKDVLMWKSYEIRDCFIPDNPETESIIAIDFENLEMKLLAHFSEDPRLVEAFMGGEDIHGVTAKDMFSLECTGKEVKKKYGNLRQIAKSLNFGLMYGMGAKKLYETLAEQDAVDEEGSPITKEKAQYYYDLYFETYAGVGDFIKNQKKLAHKNESITTLIGRKRRLKRINGSDFKTVSYEERLAVNATIQGCQDLETPILTTVGYVPIKDLDTSTHELVTSSGTTSKYTIWDSGDKMLYRLATNYSEIDASLDHRFMIYDKGDLIFKQLKDLVVGDFIAYREYNPRVETPKSNTMDIYEFIGALIGDGSYSGDRHTFRLHGGLEKMEYLKEAQKFVISHWEYNSSIAPTKGSIGESYAIDWEGKYMWQEMSDLGLERKSGAEKSIPKSFMTESASIKCSLLRGLFNTDGGWSGNHLTYTSISEILCLQIYNILMSLGIKARFKRQPKCFRVFVDQSYYSRFKELIGFKIPFKQDRLENTLDKQTRDFLPSSLVMDIFDIVYTNNIYTGLAKNDKCAVLRFKVGSATRRQCLKYLYMCEQNKRVEELIEMLNSVYFDKITKITKLSTKPTKDIEIFTEDHSYIANGMICHNSGADLMMMCQPMIEADERLKELGCTMRMQIHDELVAVCPKEHLEEAIAIISNYMEHALPTELNVPITVSSGVGASYAEAK